MKTKLIRLLCFALLGCVSLAAADGWINMFDGKTLDGWKANERPESWTAKDGESLYNFKNITEQLIPDDTWWTMQCYRRGPLVHGAFYFSSGVFLQGAVARNRSQV